MQAMEVDAERKVGKRGASRGRKPRRVKARRGAGPAVLRHSAAEVKSVDLNDAGSAPYTTAINSTAAVILLNGMVPGSNLQNRLGRKIAMKSVRLLGNIIWNGNGAVNYDFFRLMIVYDRQPNGALPALSDILQTVDPAGNTSSTVWDHVNLSNRDRFQILRNRMYSVNSHGGSSTFVAGAITDGRWQVDEFVRLKDLETHFNTGVAGTVADMTTGALLLVLVGATAAANNQADLNWTSRVRFTDL